jgi:hypothetical protein
MQGGLSAAHAAKIKGECSGTTVTDFISSDQTNVTESTNWVDLVDGTLNFTTARPGCVIITFSGPAYDYAYEGEDYNQLHLQTVLDRNSLCVPPAYNDAVAQDRFPTSTKTISITRVCTNVGSGGHRVRVQFRSEVGASHQVVILSHTLTVAHR